MKHAEDIYFFTHAVLQQAAYQLLPPSVRAGLHATAVELLADLPDPPAGDIALHARLAREGVTQFDDSLVKVERVWLERAVTEAETSYRAADVIRLFQRLALIHRDGSPEQVQTWCRLAHALTDLNRINEAAPLAEQALKVADELNDPALQATACNALGAAFRDGERNAESGGYYRRARDLFRQNGDVAGQAKVALGLAGLLWIQGNLQEAEAVAREACELGEQALGSKAAAGAWMNRLGILIQSSKFDEAKLILKHLDGIASSNTDPGLLMRIHAFRGYAWDVMDDKQQARIGYATAMDLAQQTGNQAEIARCQTNLALLDMTEGCFAQARARHTAAERTAREHGDLRIAAYACAGQSLIDCRLGDFRSGLERTYAALRIARKLGMGGIVTSWQVTAGLLHAELGDLDTASEMLLDMDKADDDRSEAVRLSVLAVIESRTGNTPAAQELATTARDTLPPRPNEIDPPGQRWVDMALALLA